MSKFIHLELSETETHALMTCLCDARRYARQVKADKKGFSCLGYLTKRKINAMGRLYDKFLEASKLNNKAKKQ